MPHTPILVFRIDEYRAQEVLPRIEYPDDDGTNDMVIGQDLIPDRPFVSEQPFPKEIAVVIAVGSALFGAKMPLRIIIKGS